ncbi:MAG: hypothetical protein HQL06_10080 [Nitrospirae bacterium]|nr:hypothetical protein [Nitrospirota bacterium]MBF0344563.1 hypothetical protein [Nitrospirota bacterium]
MADKTIQIAISAVASGFESIAKGVNTISDSLTKMKGKVCGQLTVDSCHATRCGSFIVLTALSGIRPAYVL